MLLNELSSQLFLDASLSDLNADQHLEMLNDVQMDILNVPAPLKVFKAKPKSERWSTPEVGSLRQACRKAE